jgi:hypothetical protein
MTRTRRWAWRTAAVMLVGLCLLAGGAAAETSVTLTINETATEVRFTGAGTAADPFAIGDVTQLQAIAANRSAHYVLVDDIDATPAASWRDAAGGGFRPIGGFNGSLDGAGYAVEGLSIDRPRTDTVGLFASTAPAATVRALRLTDVQVTGSQHVGALAGRNGGTIDAVAVTGSVSGTSTRVGAVAGRSSGTIRAVTVDATVTGVRRPAGSSGGTMRVASRMRRCGGPSAVSAGTSVG